MKSALLPFGDDSLNLVEAVIGRIVRAGKLLYGVDSVLEERNRIRDLFELILAAFDVVSGLNALIDQFKHFSVQRIDFALEQVDFVGASVQADCLADGCFHKRHVGGSVLLVKSVERSHDGVLECFLIDGGGFLTVLLSVVETVYAPPDDPFLLIGSPCDSLIAAAALPTD